ncbi:MAG: hypothetical protein PHP32_03220 [Candidatus Izemoplasmatales bacterium]|nr:hypothetical protein [Candidatus Izemoplasmatales bacterium]
MNKLLVLVLNIVFLVVSLTLFLVGIFAIIDPYETKFTETGYGVMTLAGFAGIMLLLTIANKKAK